MDWDCFFCVAHLGQMVAVARRFSTKHGVFAVGGATVVCKVAVGYFQISKDMGIAWGWFEMGSV